MIYTTSPTISPCVRKHNSRFMDDGEGFTCQEIPNSQPCSRCKPVTIGPTFAFNQKDMYQYQARVIQNTLDLVEAAVSSQEMQVFHEAMNISREKRAGWIDLDNSYAGQFYHMLLDHSAGCIICLVRRKQHVPWHDIMSCPAMQSVDKSQYGSMRGNIKHVILLKPAKSVCWICHVPQLNNTVHAQYSKANREC